jgi:hypothetical protein
MVALRRLLMAPAKLDSTFKAVQGREGEYAKN